jgi:shikimate dehydrogenase
MRRITGATRVAGVIGSPVRHSLSPAMHNAAFEAAGLDWSYLAFEVAEGDAARALEGMRSLGIEGLSVTMPHKQDVARSVDILTPAARALDAVNCVARLEDGRLEGLNTDGAGFVASLRDAGVNPAGMSVVVLGAGGAARAVIEALASAGAARVSVVNRTVERADPAARLAGECGVVGSVADVARADLIVNATPVGMGSEEIPVDGRVLRSSQVVADLVYHPRRTTLLAFAEEVGATTVDGLGMLVHQAALAFTRWTSCEAPVDVMRAAAEAELAARA